MSRRLHHPLSRTLVGAAALALTLAAVALGRDWLLRRAPASTLRSMARLLPRSSTIQYHLGWAYARVGLLEPAVTAWESARLLNPSDPRPLRALVEQEVARGRLGRGGESYLEQLLALAPNDAWAHLQRGMVWRRQGKTGRAIAEWRTATQLDPGLGEAWHHLGLAYTQQLQYEQACQALERAIALQPDSAEPLVALGRAYMGSGRLEQALQTFQQALQLDPAHPAAHRFVGQLLCQWQPTRENLKQARAHLEAALQTRPHFPEAAYWLGRVCLGLGDHTEAERHLRAALKDRPIYAEAIFQLGRLCLQTGRREEGETYLEYFDRIVSLGTDITHLRDRIGLEPDNPDWHLRLAQALHQLGWKEAAIHHYRQALALDPQAEEARKALQSLSADERGGR